MEVAARPTSAPFTAETLNYGQMDDRSIRLHANCAGIAYLEIRQ